MSERWKPVPGYEGRYEVSDLGRVASLARRHHRIMSPSRTRDRPKVKLYDGGGGFVWKLVHRLVLEAFVGPCPPGAEACHWNGDRADARLSNLRWDTHEANCADNIRNGVRQGALPGSAHPNARLNEADVRAIRAAPEGSATLAAAYGVSARYVRDIRRGLNWAHLP